MHALRPLRATRLHRHQRRHRRAKTRTRRALLQLPTPAAPPPAPTTRQMPLQPLMSCRSSSSLGAPRRLSSTWRRLAPSRTTATATTPHASGCSRSNATRTLSTRHRHNTPSWQCSTRTAPPPSCSWCVEVLYGLEAADGVSALLTEECVDALSLSLSLSLSLRVRQTTKT